MRGGTIIQPLFHDIGANFHEDDHDAIAIVERIAKTEEELIEAGELPSDYCCGVFQKNKR